MQWVFEGLLGIYCDWGLDQAMLGQMTSITVMTCMDIHICRRTQLVLVNRTSFEIESLFDQPFNINVFTSEYFKCTSFMTTFSKKTLKSCVFIHCQYLT